MAGTMDHILSRRAALLLFAVVVLMWGSNWAVTKALVLAVSPLWATAIRSAIATVALLLFLLVRGQLILPRRGDVPVILSVAVLHMGAFSALVAFGLQFVPVGRSIVLGYTTPLWVAPGAWLFLSEPVTRSRLVGIALGLAGLATMFNPLDFDWSDRSALLGNGLILLAALCWAANILYIRAHKWISTPFQLVFWQALLATSISSTLALWIDGAPRVTWSFALAGAFLYAGICGTALAHWAMVMVNRSLPTVTTSLGLLATPVVGVATSVICLGAHIGTSLICAMAMILGGIAIGTIPRGKGVANRQCPPPVRCAIRTRPHFAGGSARSHGTSSPAENGPSSSVRELRTLAALSPASAGVQGQSPAIPSLTRP
jgi:drug/metabolite transporter (DMT)-like permease